MAEKRKQDEQAQLLDVQQKLQQQAAAKPAPYESRWNTQIADALDKVLNRESFSYDLNEDAFYQHYKNAYDRQGQQAMRDAYGQAAALTGGYGNSYAQTAARQAYAGSMDQLQEKIPQLYELALERYRMEGDSLRDTLGLLQQQEQGSYDRYQDEFSRWQSEQKRLEDGYRDAYSRYESSRDHAYKQQRDKIADEQWLKEFNEAIRQFNVKVWG